MSAYSIDQLKQLEPQHDFFIGIDSDGCVFDTMEIKQKECFIPQIIKIFKLQAVSKYVRQSAEFVNLYSKWRGANRYPALLQTLGLTADRPEVQKRGVHLPDTTPLQKWVQEETKLGLPALRAKVQGANDPFLALVLQWSESVDHAVEDMVSGLGPFAWVREFLDEAQNKADMIVVSQTPTPALVREWQENEIDHRVRLIAGQEYGTKAEHLKAAAGGKYPNNHVLMIGDALGDLQAAQTAGALFFPILPGEEDASWERLFKEGLDRFINETFAGAYEASLLHQFERVLPSTPPWQQAD